MKPVSVTLHPMEEHKEPLEQPNGEFHHFQLVNAAGEIPLSISVLVHYAGNKINQALQSVESPIGTDDIIEFHEALKAFDGNFINAFSKQK